MTIDVLVKATLVLIVALVGVRLAARARASVRHALLATALGAIALLPIAALALPAIDLPILPPHPHVSFVDAADAPGIPISGAAGRPALLTHGRETAAETQRPAASAAREATAIVRAVWLTGAALVLISLGIGIARIHRLRQAGVPCRETQQLMPALIAQAGVRSRIDVVTHEQINAPLTCGTLRPAVVLPPDAQQWSEAALIRALVHEIEHVKRRDWVVQVAARAVCAIYWFHPLVWIVYRQLCLEAEHACDDAVVARQEETTYADQLVTLARRIAARPAMAVLGMAERSDLAARVDAILDPARPRGRAGALRTTVIAATAAALLLALAPLQLVAQTSSRAPLLKSGANSPAEDSGSPIGDVTLPAPSGSPSGGLAGERSVQSSRLNRILVEAAEEGDLRDVRAILDAGGNVNAIAIADGTPLIAAARGGHLDLVQLLLERGADVNLAVSGDGNPLIMAAREGHLVIVQLLIERGADIEAMVPGDENALITASANGQLDVVRYLVSRGANVNARTWVEQVWGRQGGEWRSPLSMALAGGHTAVADFLRANGAVQ